ncbi:MAG TPA: hypothetical protein VH595_06435 [Verrucomicrobiae bacterium]|nr:hypothetical protein [Verrucomicrobiae bacterium]
MNEVPQQGTSVACSADGTKLVAAVFDIGGSPGGPIYLSPNSGITWTQANVPSNYWTSVASSADGSKLIAAANYDSGGGLYTSTNFGITWMSNNLAPKWVAASADGSEFVAVNGGEVLTTTNGGVTWRTVLTLPQSFFYESIAVSADGTELILGAGGIYISTNSGSAWAQDTNAPSTSWNGISVSADGSKLAGVSQAAGGSGGAGGIFFPQPFFTPVLNFTLLGGQPMLSWVVPSADFILQQNLDPAITKWLVVTNLRGANLRNLSGTVSVYPSNNWNFYRLAPR